MLRQKTSFWGAPTWKVGSRGRIQGGEGSLGGGLAHEAHKHAESGGEGALLQLLGELRRRKACTRSPSLLNRRCMHMVHPSMVVHPSVVACLMVLYCFHDARAPSTTLPIRETGVVSTRGRESGEEGKSGLTGRSERAGQGG
jgi:hypothetical protein